MDGLLLERGRGERHHDAATLDEGAIAMGRVGHAMPGLIRWGSPGASMGLTQSPVSTRMMSKAGADELVTALRTSRLPQYRPACSDYRIL